MVVWEGEAPAEPVARNRHSVRLARRLALPKTPPKLSHTQSAGHRVPVLPARSTTPALQSLGFIVQRTVSPPPRERWGAGSFQSAGRKPGDMFPQRVRRRAPAALIRRTHSSGAVTGSESLESDPISSVA